MQVQLGRILADLQQARREMDVNVGKFPLKPVVLDNWKLNLDSLIRRVEELLNESLRT